MNWVLSSTHDFVVEDSMAIESNARLDPETLKIPAVFSNRFQLLTASGNVRITFAESGQASPEDTPVVAYRSAIVLTIDDARQLAHAILQGTNPFVS